MDDAFPFTVTEVIIACKARDRYFDLDAVREAPTSDRAPTSNGFRGITDGGPREPTLSHPAGAPPLDWWIADDTYTPDPPPEGLAPMTVKYHIGDVRKVLATFPPHTFDVVMTSPPFLALRSYLPGDHPDKALEIGSEATPGEFIDALLDVVEACERVLAPHGSIVFELGDSYSGSGGAGGDYDTNGWRSGQPKFGGSASRADSWPLDKSLALIPELFRIALVYGFNPLTGRATPRWRARNVVRWCRPNPPVGALGDKFRPATTDLVVACKARDRYFDLDAVREPSVNPGTIGVRPTMARTNGTDDNDRRDSLGPYTADMKTAGAPPLDHWIISTAPYKGAHYATYPPDLCVRPIKAMCPERVCTTCGNPSRRIVGEAEYVPSEHYRGTGRDKGDRPGNFESFTVDGSVVRNAPTLGWTDCGHGDNWRPGHVLDPFAGSGTTLAVAHGHGRDATGIDLDPRNAELAYGRLGLFLEVEGDTTASPDFAPHNTMGTHPYRRAGYMHPAAKTPLKKDYGT